MVSLSEPHTAWQVEWQLHLYNIIIKYLPECQCTVCTSIYTCLDGKPTTSASCYLCDNHHLCAKYKVKTAKGITCKGQLHHKCKEERSGAAQDQHHCRSEQEEAATLVLQPPPPPPTRSGQAHKVLCATVCMCSIYIDVIRIHMCTCAFVNFHEFYSWNI